MFKNQEKQARGGTCLWNKTAKVMPKGSIEKLVKLLTIVVITISGGIFAFWVFEPAEVQSAEDTVNVSLTVTSEINIGCSTDAVTLSPSINGQTGGSATGTFSCTAETNDTSGYTMKIKENHKLQTDASGNPDTYFADYTEGTPLDFNWSAPSSGNEVFGFNITAGDDTVQKYRNATGPASPCNTAGGIVSEDHCWNGFKTTDEEVASRNSPTPAGGVATTFGLKAEVAANNNLHEGTYSNTLTITALTQ